MIGFLSLWNLVTALGCMYLFVIGIFSIASEATYYEKQKDPEKEENFILIPGKNTQKNVYKQQILSKFFYHSNQ